MNQTCPSCRGASLSVVLRGDSGAWTLYRCRSCFAYPVLPLPEKGVRETYDASYFERGHADDPRYAGYLSYDGMRRAAIADFRRLLGPYVRRGMRLLDIGCATGAALEAGRDLGVSETDLQGIDISPYALSVAHRHLPGATFVRGDAREADLAGSFDVILCFDLLEHLSDPSQIFSRAVAALAPGGVLCVLTPDPESGMRRVFGKRWSEFHYGEHLCFVGRAWFEAQARIHGLRMGSVQRPGKHVSVEHLSSRMRAYIPFMPIVRSPRMIYANGFDRLFVTFTRV